MKKFKPFTSKAAPLMQPNIDTDIITPMNRIVLPTKKPISYYAFEPLRYSKEGADKGEPNPEFVLNKPEYQNVQILVTGKNFGCGSSRETAPMAIAGLGIQCLIGSSFGDIFFNNCFQQGLLPIKLSVEIVETLAEESATGEFTINLEERTILSPSGSKIVFEVNEFRRNCLLKGLDDIEMTLNREGEIAAFQEKDQKLHPWIYQFG